MRLVTFAFLSFLLHCSVAMFAQERYWQQELVYDIDVTLDDKTHTLDGTLRLKYKNNSPDTLDFVWFHIWPNAFKNDRTAFSEQSLRQGRTAFYYSPADKKGYINRLDFKTAEISLEAEDHPLYIDVIKVILSKPLGPGAVTEITTPFHVQLPYNFSRGGHNGIGDQSYQLTQWYPKPAVYDAAGWHPMPYLDQGEYYSEFGTYNVSITLPKNYVVAATGELQDAEEIEWMKSRNKKPERQKIKPPKNKNSFGPPRAKLLEISSDAATKTLHYKQDRVHDFAIFADKYFKVDIGTIELPSGKNITAFSFYTEKANDSWAKSIDYIRAAIQYRSSAIGEYPYNTVSVVGSDFGIGGGMEYPMITIISPSYSGAGLESVIEHEVGHNWFQGILGSDEREHPWLDEGLNTYFNERYETGRGKGRLRTLNQQNNDKLRLQELELQHLDQPVETASENLRSSNYYLVVYIKAAAWLRQLEQILGTEQFDKAIKFYYETWKFRHPSPADFRQSLETSSGQDLSAHFKLLTQKGKLPAIKGKKKLIFNLLPKPSDPDSVNNINIQPVPGYNTSDGLMIGVAVHNYANQNSRFKYVLAPLYATRTGQMNGIGDLGYSFYSDRKLQKVRVGLNFARFSTLSELDSTGKRISAGFMKIVPSIKLVFRNNSPLSTQEKFLEWRTFIIGETGFRYSESNSNGIFYPAKTSIGYRYINQLGFVISDNRVLYPYNAMLQLQQGSDFYRVNLDARYFFNYPAGGGMHMRLFAAKFGYLGKQTTADYFKTFAYQPKLTAVRGSEDYTYSNYFLGRNDAHGIGSQQMMMRDGGLKIRTDMFQDLQGRSDNWVSSINLSTTIPGKVLPRQIPFRIFADVGTYAGAWDKEATGSRFLYVAGLQLSLFKEVLNIYAPIIYSRQFSDNLKTVPEENKFLRKISFSIDIQRVNFRKFVSK